MFKNVPRMGARDDAPPVVVIAGPTASGKSALALLLAEHMDATVINADAMQVYRDLRVATARPSPEDEARVPHRLYGMLAAQDPCSAARWSDLAHEAICQARAEGRRPIVVGGSGLYLKAMIDGIAAIPRIPAETRARAEARYALIGPAAFHEELAALDPDSAERLHPCDRQRLTRAWEVWHATGRALSHWHNDAVAAKPGRYALIALMPARAALYHACNQRFHRMLDAGVLDEVRALCGRGLDPSLPVLRAVGVRELAGCLAGRVTRDRAIELAQQATRRFAKRQMTWLRNQWPTEANGNITSSTTFDAQHNNNIGQEILNIIT